MTIPSLPEPVDLEALAPDVAYNITQVMARIARVNQLQKRELVAQQLAGAVRPLVAAALAAVVIGALAYEKHPQATAQPSIDQLIVSSADAPDVVQLLDAWGN